MRNWMLAAAMIVAAGGADPAQGADLVRAYQAREGLQGTVRLKGSDSMDPLLRLWIQEFRKLQPAVQFSVESHGSATAPPALVKQEADIGPMSRAMNEAEAEAFRSRFGCEPTGLAVAHDALAIYVNRRNPLKSISLAQLDAIYGTTRLAGAEKPIDGWWQVPLPPSAVQRYWVRPYSRDENSGSRAFFKEKVLLKAGAFKETVRIKDQMGILDVVSRDLNAIGYGPESYTNPLVRMVPLRGPDGGPACLPTRKNIQSGRYALSRTLYLYVNRAALEPAAQAFLEFALSRQGQTLVEAYGSAPLADEAAEAGLAQIR